ncbi:MAG: PAS domain S-box protein [Acetobacteraceae bacterium]|nr:PAS domain S-box protein [Acetobacteraceae bacterium]
MIQPGYTGADHRDADFPRDGGETGGLIRRFDWSATSLGPIRAWPQSLRSTVSLILPSPVPMVTLWGPDGVMIYNDAYSTFAGGRHPRLLGSRVLEGWPEIADFNRHVMQVGLAGGTLVYRDHHQVLHRNGYPEDVWMDLNYSPILDEAQKPIGVLAIVQETSGRVQAEAARRRLRQTLAAQVAERTKERDRIWRNSQDLLLVIGGDGVLQAVNPAWSTTLGYEAEALVGRHFQHVVHPEDLEAAAGALLRASRGRLRGFECRLRHKDGSWRWLSWTAAPEEGVIYANGRDITAEKEAAEALRQAEDALRQSQKMEAVGQLTGGIAHDFNNMLTGIIGSLQMLRRRVGQGRTAELERYVEAAVGAAERAASLTHRLLSFARRRPLDPKPVDIAQLVGGMAELLRRTMGEAIELRLPATEGSWPIHCDPNQLENALLNLAINARDAMPEGGTLTIAAALREVRETDPGREHWATPGEYVVLSVTDTGCGMPPEVLARALDPFFTTKPQGVGTGLGLSMVYGFCRQSGGHMRLRSRPGQGTVVELCLPCYRGEVRQEPAPAPGTGLGVPRTQGKEVVLVVEDDPTVRALAAEVLRDLGYRVLEAADGPSGLAALHAASQVDLLVTDIGLPGGMNGRQLADQARAARPGLRVLFITGYAGAAAALGFLEPGMALLAKPFTVEALGSRVRDMIKAA